MAFDSWIHEETRRAGCRLIQHFLLWKAEVKVGTGELLIRESDAPDHMEVTCTLGLAYDQAAIANGDVSLPEV